MTINTSKQAIAKALGQTHNTPGTCQLAVRTWFNAPSAGDQDHDGDADAIDGWKSEPIAARHVNRNPPAGKPLAFRNATHNGFGHRALSLEGGKVRSTDFDTVTQRWRAGVVGTANSITAVERAMGLVYLGWSETIDGQKIPTETVPVPVPAPTPAPKPAPTHKRLNTMHVSLQVQDTAAQVRADVKKIFTRAQERKVLWVTGTEAFGPKVFDPLQDLDDEFGFRVYRPAGTDAWIALRKSFVDSEVETWFHKVVEGGTEHRDLSVFGVSFHNDDIGDVTIFAQHLLRSVHANAEAKNKRALLAISAHAAAKGKGSGKVFYGGDQNQNDRRVDTFKGTPFTSAEDELEKWEDTGHGPIDCIASWDPDGGVKAVDVHVLNDKEFHLYGDHFVVEAAFDAKMLTN